MTIAGYTRAAPLHITLWLPQLADPRIPLTPVSISISKLLSKSWQAIAVGARGFTLMKDFGGLSEEEYWQRLIEQGGQINSQFGPYSAVSINSHSALNSMKNYANPGSSPYQLTWHLTPASGVNVMPGASAGSAPSASSRSTNTFGLRAHDQVTSSNVGAFISFISQFLK